MKNRIIKLALLIGIVFTFTLSAAPPWVPANLASKLDASPNLPADDSIKNILVPDYESRIAALDTTSAVVKRTLHQLYDNVILLYYQYNRGYSYGPIPGLLAIQEDMNFYLPLLEAGSDPDDALPGRWMKKAFIGKDNLLNRYYVMSL